MRQSGVDGEWKDGGHFDVVAGILLPQLGLHCVHEAPDGELGGAVGREEGSASHPGHAAQADDVTVVALQKLGQELIQRPELRKHVDFEDLLDVRRRHLGEGLGGHDSGVVYQHCDWSSHRSSESGFKNLKSRLF